MYRFGDGTPFPLRENFIDTIVAAVDCCVSLHHMEMEVESRHLRMREARKLASDELKRLDALKALIETAVTPLIARKERALRTSETAAAKIYENAQSIIRQSRESVVQRRDTVIQDGAHPEPNDAILDVLGAFFRGHSLPRTEWRLRWQAGGGEAGPITELWAQAARDLDLTFACEIPADSPWAAAQTTADLVPGLSLATSIDTGTGRPRAIKLEAMQVVEVHVAPGRDAFVLRENTRRAALGLHVVMPRGADTAPLVVALDRRDQPSGQPFYLDEAGSAALHAIWAALDARLADLLAVRTGLSAARLGGRDATIVDHPSQIAEAILLSLAPLIREMRMRSRVPGELILKRDLGGDRREEMFVPRQVLWQKLDTLPSHHRQVFEAVGLGNEATSEFVTRLATHPGPRRTTRVPLPAAAGDSAIPHPVDSPFDRGSHALELPAAGLGLADDHEATRPKADRPTEVSGIIDAVRASA
jgi:hypothetical protein